MVTENRIKKYFYETKMSGFIDLFNVGKESRKTVSDLISRVDDCTIH